MSVQRLALIVPAAGSGRRMGGGDPKPYLQVAGKTILEHTLSRFTGVDGLEEVVVSTSAPYLDQTRDILSRTFPGIAAYAVPGGEERQYSIRNALAKISSDAELIAVHDAVRPFVDRQAVLNCIEKAAEYGGAIVAIPAKDTIKVAGPQLIIEETPDRNKLWQAQTPQIFRADLFRRAYRQAGKRGVAGTDDASLVEQAGGTVKLVEGSGENFKITFPLDLRLAKILLK